jgi:hypothetical protein
MQKKNGCNSEKYPLKQPKMENTTNKVEPLMDGGMVPHIAMMYKEPQGWIKVPHIAKIYKIFSKTKFFGNFFQKSITKSEIANKSSVGTLMDMSFLPYFLL